MTAMEVALGLDVLAIEPREIGSECLNTGYIALLKASEAIHEWILAMQKRSYHVWIF